MASSRNSPPDLEAALAASLRTHFPVDSRITVALSGGIDSVVLLHALARARKAHRVALAAHHVHHGLSPEADRWLEFCARLCRDLDVAFSFTRLDIARQPQESLEALARDMRHAALAALDCDVIALAHHADDQAETVLLQLLRGAGVAGLAAMPALRLGHPSQWRPLLAYPRKTIEAWAAREGITHVEDESNADTKYRRNFLRHEIAPRLAPAFPGYPLALARSARHCASAKTLLRELADIDGLAAAPRGELAISALRAVSETRAANLLRHFFHREGLIAPSEARLSAFVRALREARASVACELAHDGRRMRIHQGILRFADTSPAPFDLVWHGEKHIDLPHGVLKFEETLGEGMSPSRLRAAACRIATRGPGARLRLHERGPARSLKNLFQEAGIPAWERNTWPMLYCGSDLVAVPGIGVAAAYRCAPDEAGWRMTWQRSMPT